MQSVETSQVMSSVSPTLLMAQGSHGVGSSCSGGRHSCCEVLQPSTLKLNTEQENEMRFSYNDFNYQLSREVNNALKGNAWCLSLGKQTCKQIRTIKYRYKYYYSLLIRGRWNQYLLHLLTGQCHVLVRMPPVLRSRLKRAAADTGGLCWRGGTSLCLSAIAGGSWGEHRLHRTPVQQRGGSTGMEKKHNDQTPHFLSLAPRMIYVFETNNLLSSNLSYSQFRDNL